MVVTSRPYRTIGDLRAVGRLIRRAYAEERGLNAWTFARWDIWAQRRIADAEALGDARWRDDLALWEDGDHELVGAAFIGEAPNDGVLVLHPGGLALGDDLVAWVESRHGAGGSVEPLLVEALAGGEAAALLERRGYEVDAQGWYVRRAKRLDGAPSPVVLPAGYAVSALRQDELEGYHDAVAEVFRRRGSVEAYRYVLQARSYVPELNLVVRDPRGAIVSFCTAWLDWENDLAELEPVGTVPPERGRGLAAAVIAEAENRMRKLGPPLVTVHSWSTMDGANGLYDALGYAEVGRQQNWRRAPPS